MSAILKIFTQVLGWKKPTGHKLGKWTLVHLNEKSGTGPIVGYRHEDGELITIEDFSKLYYWDMGDGKWCNKLPDLTSPLNWELLLETVEKFCDEFSYRFFLSRKGKKWHTIFEFKCRGSVVYSATADKPGVAIVNALIEFFDDMPD